MVLLEAETVGHGASGRNGGFVFGGYSLGERELAGAAGAEQARKLYQLTLDAVATIRRRIARYGIACDAVNGGIYLANWFNNGRILDDHQRFMADTLGVEWQRISRADFAGRARSERYFGALYEENALHFHPLKYAQGLARALAAGGVGVHEQSRVTRIAQAPATSAANAAGARGAGWRIMTAEGEVRAREVVVCCGGYIERLYPRLAGAILPIATYVMVTEPLGSRLPTALATEAAIYDTRFAFDYYRPLPDSRLLWGGRIAVRERSAADVARLLRGDMLKVYPQLAGARIDYAWSGMMSYGRHKMPQLAAARGHLVRHGFRRPRRRAYHAERRGAGRRADRRRGRPQPLPAMGPAHHRRPRRPACRPADLLVLRTARLAASIAPTLAPAQTAPSCMSDNGSSPSSVRSDDELQRPALAAGPA